MLILAIFIDFSKFFDILRKCKIGQYVLETNFKFMLGYDVYDVVMI